MLVVKWWNQNKNTWYLVIEVYYLFILFIFQESIRGSEFIDQSTNQRIFIVLNTSFYIYYYNYLNLYELKLIWTLFKIYDSDVFYFILFQFMIKYLFFK